MYRSILVPLDGSAAAEEALPMALSLARRFAAALTIIHVHVPIWGVYGEGGLYDPLIDREIRDGMQAYLNGVVKRISTGTDISLSSAVLEGLVPGAIKRHATESGVDLVVMTTQGRGPVARFWLGSVADRLVRQSTIPILFVRPQEGRGRSDSRTKVRTHANPARRVAIGRTNPGTGYGHRCGDKRRNHIAASRPAVNAGQLCPP